MANSIKNLVTSVDWKKMLSSSDARNALVGSALGAAMLGGAGLMQKRDPEESKLAPVGDALMGALFGGVAGYGIPKGLALFADSGTLAPDGDTLKTNYLGWGLGGAAAGAGVFGTSLYKTLKRTADHLRAKSERDLPGFRAQVKAYADAAAAPGSKASPDVAERLARKVKMLSGDGATGLASETLAGLRRQYLAALFSGDSPKFLRLWKEVGALKGFRDYHTQGYNGFGSLMKHVADESVVRDKRPLGALRSLLAQTWRHGVPRYTHGGHYATGNLLGIGPRVGPVARAVLRGGKYALGGAALGMLAHKLLGPDASHNYKN